MDNSHTNPAFDAAINRMEELLAQMEDRVAGQIAAARAVLLAMDVAQSRELRKRDKELNALGEKLEDQAVLVLAKHQPVAEDLRRVVGALKMSIEYERAGDYVKHLAKSIGKMAAHEENLKITPALSRPLAAAEKMFSQFLAARRAGDAEQAARVWLKDQKIDDLCAEAVRAAFENQQKGDGDAHSLIHAVSAAKNIERFGDKIKNLAEIFYRQKTGEHLDVKLDD